MAKNSKPRAAKKAAAKKPPRSRKADAPDAPASIVNDGRLVVTRGPNVDLVGTFKVTTADQLATIVRGYNNLKKDSKTASGLISDLLGKAEEHKHLNKQAFQMAIKLFNMTPEKLCRVWPILLKYCDDLGIPQKATEQAELFAQAVAADAAKAAQTDIEDEGGEKDPGKQVAAAAQALSPSRRHRMSIVPKPSDGEAPEPSGDDHPQGEAAAG